MTTLSRAFVFLGLVGILVLSTDALDSLHVGTFSTGTVNSYARDKGYFTQQGLSVSFTRVDGSEAQFLDYDAGVYDLITTSGDNVLFRRLGQGRTNLVIVAQYDGAPGQALFVNTNLGLQTLEDTVGKTLLADGIQSGFVTALREFYFKASLPPITENLLIAYGGDRREALINGETNGTMNNGASTFFLDALNPHIKKVAELEPLVCPYLGNVLVARTSWLQSSTNRDKLVRFLRAVVKAWKYVTTPANAAEVIADLGASNDINSSLAELLYNKSIISPNVGLAPYLIPVMKGTENAIHVRSVDLQVTAPPCIPTSGYLVSQPGGFFDISYLNTALAQELQFYNAYGLFYSHPNSQCV